MSLVIQRIRVEDFRGLSATEVSLNTSGVTIVQAPNEAGKSSLMEAIDLALTTKATSHARHIKAVQPVGRDVGSLVELEMTCGPYHLVVRKRFNKNTMTELEIRAPSPEQFSGDEGHDRLRQVVEAEVDEQLFGAIWLRQGRALENLDLHDSSALAQALDARAGGGGLEVDDALVDRVSAEFQKYFTPTGKDGRPLKEVDSAVTAAQTELGQREEDLRNVENAVSRLEEINQELAVLTHRKSEVDAQRRDLEGRMKDVQQARESVRNAEAAAGEAKSRCLLTEERLTQRRTRVAEIERLTARVQELSEALQPEHTHERELAEELQGADEAAREAAAHEKEEAARRAQATGQASLIRKRDELANLVRREKGAQTASEQLARAQAVIERNDVTSQALDGIRQARNTRQLARSKLDANTPELTMTAHQELSLTINDESVEILAGASHRLSIDGHIVVDAAPYLSIDVRAGDSTSSLSAELDTAESNLEQLLGAAGVSSVDAAEVAAEARTAAEKEMAQAQQELQVALGDLTRDQLLESIEALRAEIDGLTHVWGEPSHDTTLEDAVAAAAAAETAETQRREEAVSAREARDRVRDQLTELRQRLAGNKADLTTRREDLQTSEERLSTERANASDELLDAEAEQVRQDCEHLDEQVRAGTDRLLALEPDTVEALASNTTKELEDIQRQIREDENRQTELRTTVSLRGGEGLGESRDEAQSLLDRTMAEQRRIRSRAAAAKRLKGEIDSAREEAYTTYREPLRQAIVKRGRIVFGQTFDVELDDGLGLVSRSWHGRRVPWVSLSSGTKEQLAVLTGIAVASLASAGGVPLVLDDTLGYTDLSRLETLGAVLGNVSDAQVIVLACVPDRFSRIGGARRVTLPSRPAGPGDQAEPGKREVADSGEQPHAAPDTADDGQEALTCTQCGRDWTRTRTRGRKPARCPECASDA